MGKWVCCKQLLQNTIGLGIQSKYPICQVLLENSATIDISLIAEFLQNGQSNSLMLKGRDMKNSLESCLLEVKILYIDPTQGEYYTKADFVTIG